MIHSGINGLFCPYFVANLSGKYYYKRNIQIQIEFFWLEFIFQNMCFSFSFKNWNDLFVINPPLYYRKPSHKKVLLLENVFLILLNSISYRCSIWGVQNFWRVGDGNFLYYVILKTKEKFCWYFIKIECWCFSMNSYKLFIIRYLYNGQILPVPTIPSDMTVVISGGTIDFWSTRKISF